MEHEPITVSIERTVDPARIGEATIWVQAGINLANKYPGFLGSGWVRAGETSDIWYMLYRFRDDETLLAWENSSERAWWLSSGKDFMQHRRSEKRTGIEGWFDVPFATSVSAAHGPGGPEATGTQVTVPLAPPRWKQAVSIWLGFFPVNLVFTFLVTWLVPGWETWGVLLHVLVSTLVLTPIMAYWVLPWVTRMLRPWLQAPSRSRGQLEA
jgi:antibiotic biosynthesis monooxygenase (ABM) superfamily enzyme